MIAALLIAAVASQPALTLDDALARAKSHPQLVEAVANERAAKAKVDEARAGFFPSASASLGDSISNSLSPQLGVAGEKGAANLFTSSVQVGETVWDFGRTRASVDAARALVDSTSADLAEAEADLALGVKSAYFAALAADALEKSAGESVDTAAKHLEDATARVDVGKSAPYDETKAKVDLGNAKLALVQAENQVKLARAQLSHAIGEDVGDAPLVAPAAVDTKPPTLDEAMNEAVAHRSELAGLDARLAADRASVALAKAAYFPSLGAAAQGSVRDFGASSPVTSWSVGATLSIPIFAGGADQARIGETEANLDALTAARQALVLDVKLDVESALVSLDGATQAATVAKDVVGEAQAALQLAEGRYEAGAGTIVELADAESQVATAKANAIKADLDLAVARAKLARALGG